MSDHRVKYCRAENGIELTESNNVDAEAVVYRCPRNGMSKLEKIFLACIVILCFACAIFASLYFSEKQRKHVENDSASKENGNWNCEGSNDGEGGEGKKENEAKKTCDLKAKNKTSCSNEVEEQAALGKLLIELDKIFRVHVQFMLFSIETCIAGKYWVSYRLIFLLSWYVLRKRLIVIFMGKSGIQ